MPGQQLSTSALAKTLQLTSQRLFTLLRDYQWIEREGEEWRLTAKGREEGGVYRQSEKFGRYIVWPEALVDHPLLQAAADTNFITATAIGEHFQRPGRYINRVLRELGWLRRGKEGWLLTPGGLRQGGVQQQGKEGAAYASWPKAIVSEPALLDTFNKLNILLHDPADHEPDLFASPKTSKFEGHNVFTALDGHTLATVAQTEVCQWLYIMGITHAYRRALPGHSDLFCDFYLPEQGLYIDIWSVTDKPHELAERLSKKDWCRQQHIILLELEQEDVANLDAVISSRFEEYGISIY